MAWPAGDAARRLRQVTYRANIFGDEAELRELLAFTKGASAAPEPEEEEEDTDMASTRCAENMSTLRQRATEEICFIAASFTIVYRTSLYDLLSRLAAFDLQAREILLMYDSLAERLPQTGYLSDALDGARTCPAIPERARLLYYKLSQETDLRGGFEHNMLQAVLEAANIPFFYADNRTSRKREVRGFVEELTRRHLVGAYTLFLDTPDPPWQSHKDLLALHDLYSRVPGYEVVGIMYHGRESDDEVGHVVAIVRCMDVADWQWCDSALDRCMKLSTVPDDGFSNTKHAEVTFVYQLQE